MLCTPTFPAEFSKNMVIYDTTVDVLKILKIYGNLGIFGKFWKFWIYIASKSDTYLLTPGDLPVQGNQLCQPHHRNQPCHHNG